MKTYYLLNLSLRRFLSYRKQSIDLLSKFGYYMIGTSVMNELGYSFTSLWKMYQLSYSLEYGMANIFQFSHILLTYSPNLQSRLQQNMRCKKNIGHIVRGKCVIASLLVTYKMSTVCQLFIYKGNNEILKNKCLSLINQ